MERRLTTILAADVVGYSRLMGDDEGETLAALKALRRELIKPKETQYRGRTVKLMGDGALMEFASVVDAVAFAVEVQVAMAERNAEVPGDRRIVYRVGLNIGDIIVEGADIYGDGVNVAARLEELSEPGGICVSRSVFDQVKDKLDLSFEHLGAKEVKNIAEPVTVYRVVLDQKAADLTTPITVPIPTPKKASPLPWSRIAAGAALSALAIAGVIWWQFSSTPVEPASVEAMAFPLPNKPSIAVLPFNNMSDDASQEYFTDGMTEDLITDLSKISGLFVIARNSSFSYKGQEVKVRQVAEELGVRYVLEGSVRRAGNEVRINAQLIDATTGGHLWADRYDGTLEDVFFFQDSVTREIVAALAITLTDEEKVEQARHHTDSPEAHDAFLRGWAYYNLLTPDDLAQAVPFFEEAIRLDPGYALAHAALASLYWEAFRSNWAFDIGIPSFRAEALVHEHLKSALKVPNTLAHALQAKMFASAGLHNDAVTEARQAVSLDANDATAHAGLAYAYVFADRPGEAIKPIETAMRLDPHHPPSYLITLGAAQFGLEQYEKAVVTFKRAVKSNPGNELPWIYLASAYGHLGQMAKADETIEAVNDVRFEQGLGELSLRDHSAFPYRVVDRKNTQFDFGRFGQAQERVRAGLVDIPALTWQYRITWRRGFGESESISLEVEGASEVDIVHAKALYDRGAVFIDASSPESFKEQHIGGSINLPYYRSPDPARPYFTRETLMAIADKSQEIVLFCDSRGCLYLAWVTAKAANWGYQIVFFFRGGTQAWKEAGFSVERVE